MGAMGTQDLDDDVSAAPTAQTPDDPPLDWWHRDHPVFTAITGFFAGLAFLSLVPALYMWVLRLFFSDETAEALFPFVLVSLAVPIGLVITERTRRFGTYMIIGMVVCGVVVAGVTALVIYVLMMREA